MGNAHSDCSSRQDSAGFRGKGSDYYSLLGRMRRYARMAGLSFTEYGIAGFDGDRFPLVRLYDEDRLVLGRPKVLVTAGFHGNEYAGPATLASCLLSIIGFARSRGVGIIVYPCVNPSGYQRGSRYNSRNEGDPSNGWHGNNDFVRYRIESGDWVDDVCDSRRGVQEWKWSSDFFFQSSPFRSRLPQETWLLSQETGLLHQDLKTLPLDEIAGIVDLHQDSYIKEQGSYAYVFGKREGFNRIIDKVRDINVPILSDHLISSGQSSGITTDKNGLLTRYDGSIADLFDNLGARFCVTVETTTSLQMVDAIKVNNLWIGGVIELVAEEMLTSASARHTPEGEFR